MTAPDPHAIARRLTAAQLTVLAKMPFLGVRPGSNLWPLLCGEDAKVRGKILFDGGDVERVARLGLAEITPTNHGRRIGEHAEMGEIWADHLCRITPLGAQVRAIVEQEQGGGDGR